MEISDIRLIEIELHSYCNRKCSFCPNSYIDRKSFKTELNEDIFLNLLNELSEQGFKNYISFSRYNEPLSDRPLLEKRIKQIRNILPDTTLVMNTNGDYDWLRLDVDELTIMDYDYYQEDFSYTRANGHQIRFMNLGEINNRAGALDIEKKERTEPCFEPTYFVGVDYTGDIVPCCNIRHDVEIHKPYVLGNLKEDSLYNILNSTKANIFRHNTSDKKFLPNICKYCIKEEGRYTREKGGIN